MLYIVSTPIGNLGDISTRAIETLKKVDVVLAEDTRVSQKMFNLLKINVKKIMSFYEEVEDQKSFEVVKMLEDGLDVALISDAGTPLLSDPGFRLLKMCRERSIEYSAIPGPSAILNALVLSGLPIDTFCFIGFLPKKHGKRLEKLKKYTDFKGSKVIFESGRRIVRLLEEIKQVYGETTRVSVCAEMTKKFENVEDGLVNDVKKMFVDRINKGEMTVVFI